MKTVLFVCTGNLCRSPLAAEYFRYLLQESRSTGVQVFSAGTHATPGALAPAEACEVARQAGFDLTNHRATFLTPELLRDADLICVMENAQKAFVHMLNPRIGDRLQLTSHWAQGKWQDREIADPYMRPLKAYQDSFRLIAAGVEGLFTEIFPATPRPRSAEPSGNNPAS